MSTSKSLILASNSPRRAFLLRECGFQLTVLPTHAPEEFDPNMQVEEVPLFLASKKAEVASASILPDQLIVTADTVVIFEGQILNKPQSESEAVKMLTILSGNMHKVITAVCLTTSNHIESIEETSWVTFHDLEKEDIKNYVRHFKPMDKAGAYGAQECLSDNYNPCSGHERNFLMRINKLNMLERSKPTTYPAKPLVAIKEITGSYFNVMGLPMASLYDKILSAL